MTGGGEDFSRVLREAGEAQPGPRPAGWDGDALLAGMREDLAAHTAARAARWAAGAARRRAARQLYERTRQQAGSGPGLVPPWLGEDAPPFSIM